MAAHDVSAFICGEFLDRYRGKWWWYYRGIWLDDMPIEPQNIPSQDWRTWDSIEPGRLHWRQNWSGEFGRIARMAWRLPTLASTWNTWFVCSWSSRLFTTIFETRSIMRFHKRGYTPLIITKKDVYSGCYLGASCRRSRRNALCTGMKDLHCHSC